MTSPPLARSLQLPYNTLLEKAYRPTDRQAEFHRATETEKLYGGAVGGGKTIALVAECMKLMWQYPHNEGIIGRRDGDDLRRTTYADFLRWCPDELIYQHHKAERWLRLVCPLQPGAGCGSLVHFQELKDLGGLKNANLGFVAFDQAEEISYDAYVWAKTRLRRADIPYRPLLLSANPAPGWVKKIFIEGVRPSIDDTPETALECCRPGSACRDGIHRFVPALPSENPHLPEGYAERQTAGMPPAYARMLIEGQWDVVLNAIYDLLDRPKHLVPLSGRERWTDGAIGVDYGRVHKSAVVTVTRDTSGVVWARECWAETGGDPQPIEDAVRSAKVRYRLHKVVADQPGAPLGYKVAESGAGSRYRRIQRVYKYLKAGALKFDASGRGVRELFEECLAYRWERRETATAEELLPVRKDDDRVAALEHAFEALEQASDYATLIQSSSRGLARPLVQSKGGGF